jgi:hypothetical protein
MQVIESFIVDKDIFLKVVIPDFNEKINYFYEPTDKLNKFDEASVILSMNEANTTIVVDALQDIMCSFCYYLKKTLNDELPLPVQVPLGALNDFYNRERYQDRWQDEDFPSALTLDCPQFWLWSTAGLLQSWMYNYDGKIYLEIGASYPNLYDEDAQRDDKKFEEYMDHYKPLLFVEVPHDVARAWLEKGEKIMRQIDSEYSLNE